MKQIIQSVIIMFMLSSSVIVYAQSISTTDEMKLRANDLADKSSSVEIPEHIRKHAEEAYDMIYNGKTGQMVDKYKNAMTYDPETGIVKFINNPSGSSKTDKKVGMAKNGIFKNNERIYVFISSSIPKPVLDNYKSYIKSKGIGDTTAFVIRGCLPQGGGFNGCKDFVPTMQFARDMIIEDNKTGVTGLVIDPVLFKTYGVTNVPQIVYAKDVNRRVDLGSEGDFGRLDNTPVWWKSVGDWSMDYHLKELQKLSGEEKLKQLYE